LFFDKTAAFFKSKPDQPRHAALNHQAGRLFKENRHPGESRDPAFRSDHDNLSEEQELDPGFRRDDGGKITSSG
jgi:hypothetical protein